MTRDLRERIALFADEYITIGGHEPEVIRIALTMNQIEEKSPPPNPAKPTDSRFSEYMKRYGDESWELDALEPAYLSDLVEGHIEQWIDMDTWNQRKGQVEDVRSHLTKSAKEFAQKGV